MAENRKREAEELVAPLPEKKLYLESTDDKPPMEEQKLTETGGHLASQRITQQDDQTLDKECDEQVSFQGNIEIAVNMIGKNVPMKLSLPVKALKNDGFTDDLINILKAISKKEEKVSETELLTLFRSGVRKMSESKALEGFLKCCRMEPSFPVKLLDDDKIIFLRAQHPSDSSAEWVSLHLATVEKVPFLKALCSDRWKTSDYQTITSVRAKNLRFLDFVYSSGENFEETSPFWSKLGSLFIQFQLDLKSTIEDFHFLDVKSKLLSDLESAIADIAQLCKNIRTSHESNTARADYARIMVIALKLGLIDTKSLKPKIRDHFYNAFYYIVSHGMFGGQIHDDVVSMYGKFKFTKNQLDQLDRVEGGLPESHDDDDDYYPFDYDDDKDMYETLYF